MLEPSQSARLATSTTEVTPRTTFVIVYFGYISGSITVDGLVVNTKYILFVTAENQVGVSNHTTVEVTTDTERELMTVQVVDPCFIY